MCGRRSQQVRAPEEVAPTESWTIAGVLLTAAALAYSVLSLIWSARRGSVVITAHTDPQSVKMIFANGYNGVPIDPAFQVPVVFENRGTTRATFTDEHWEVEVQGALRPLGTWSEPYFHIPRRPMDNLQTGYREVGPGEQHPFTLNLSFSPKDADRFKRECTGNLANILSHTTLVLRLRYRRLGGRLGLVTRRFPISEAVGHHWLRHNG